MNESTERWLPVVGYEGLYEVSDLGRVRSLPRRDSMGRTIRERIMKGSPQGGGYLNVRLSKDGRGLSRMIHLVVAEAFLGPRPPNRETRHLDGNGENNALSNLVYGTRSENMLDKVRHGTHHEANKTHCPRNHEYTVENTYVSPRGYRVCRRCWKKNG